MRGKICPQWHSGKLLFQEVRETLQIVDFSVPLISVAYFSSVRALRCIANFFHCWSERNSISQEWRGTPQIIGFLMLLLSVGIFAIAVGGHRFANVFGV